MKHLKSFKESFNNDVELSEIKSIFVEYAQDHDMDFVEPNKEYVSPIVTWDFQENGGGVYSVYRGKFRNQDNVIIVDFLWEFRHFEPVIDVDKYFDDLEEYKTRLQQMGYKIQEDHETNCQFKMILTSEE